MSGNHGDETLEKQIMEKLLPRGLEHISQRFLSQSQPASQMVENPRAAAPEPPIPRRADHSMAVVLRPCLFSDRDQLAAVLRKNPAALGDGMRSIDSNIPCETSGSIDLLAVDGANQLTIIDLQAHADDALLLRGIDHFDWVFRNMSNIRRMFQGQVINFSLQPRLIFVAPEFSILFRSVARSIASVRIDCFKYHAVALSGEVGIFFEPVFQSALRAGSKTPA
jgi:hypothetical protein